MRLPRVPQRTTPGFAFSILDRALRDCLGAREFGNAEMLETIEFFGAAECVFCGNPEISRWDHLIPIRAGGETVLGNIVPACSRCDDSKQHLDYKEWIFSTVKHSPKARGISDLENRLKRIHAYVDHYNYLPRSLPERLAPDERDRLAMIQSNIAALRIEVDGLIQDYRRRTSSQ